MRILGIGVDIIENKRIKEALKNKSFINRVYSVREQRQSNLTKIKEIEEFNIGHFIIGESIFYGLPKVIKDFKKIIKN